MEQCIKHLIHGSHVRSAVFRESSDDHSGMFSAVIEAFGTLNRSHFRLQEQHLRMMDIMSQKHSSLCVDGNYWY